MNTTTVLITGALTGIGRAAALAFAREGARIVVSDRRDDKGKAVMSTPITSVDLSRRPPRTMRLRLGGFVILARMLDRGPATLEKRQPN